MKTGQLHFPHRPLFEQLQKRPAEEKETYTMYNAATKTGPHNYMQRHVCMPTQRLSVVQQKTKMPFSEDDIFFAATVPTILSS